MANNKCTLGLPIEIIHLVLAYAVLPERPEEETLVSHIRRFRQLQLVNRIFNTMVQQLVGVHVHAYRPPVLGSIRADHGPWHVRPFESAFKHQQYWEHHVGSSTSTPLRYQYKALSLARVPHIRTLSLDLRIAEVVVPGAGHNASATNPALFAITGLLTGIWATSKYLEELNIRIPAAQGPVNLVQRIVADTVGLTRVHVEVDSTTQLGRGRMPRVDLQNFVSDKVTPSRLRTFIFRAPTCNVYFTAPPHHHVLFFNRMRHVTEFGLSSCSFSAHLPSWIWLLSLLRSTPDIELCEFSVHAFDAHFGRSSFPNPGAASVPRLREMVLQLPDVDSHLLRSLRAPRLWALRVQSTVEVDLWPPCDANHFPGLFIVHIQCPGPSFARLSALGIPFHRYISNEAPTHSEDYYHEQEFYAYIKPYNRPRPRGTAIPYSNVVQVLTRRKLQEVQTSSRPHGTLTRAHTPSPQSTSYDRRDHSDTESSVGISVSKRIRLSTLASCPR
ncbi:hypothetical protein CF319_g8708 [Tilletia indica]|uniref:F-box domain-containing protein n=1 Tax=Tilletia indica TaxID=43049 RepID=A0A8T8T9S1_9BASI|nr:hypothetical protein CF319_g8708 [Tilletia indica]KAE8258179.1 hypothetical protein A4X13_0g1858 [Tilletia indica]